MNPFTLEEYQNLPPLELPKKDNKELTYLDGFCPVCNSIIEQNRGTSKELNNCTEVHFAGICKKCKLIVSCRFRIYWEDFRILYQGIDGWQELQISRDFTFKDLFYKIINAFKIFK